MSTPSRTAPISCMRPRHNSTSKTNHVSGGNDEHGFDHLSTLSGQQQHYGYKNTVNPFNADVDHLLPGSNVDGELSMNETMFEESPTAPPGASFPLGSYSNTTSQNVGWLDEFEASEGNTESSVWDAYDMPSMMTRSPTGTSISESSPQEMSLPWNHSQQRRHELFPDPQRRHATVDLTDAVMLNPSFSSSVSPMPVPMRRLPSLNRQSPNGTLPDAFNRGLWSLGYVADGSMQNGEVGGCHGFPSSSDGMGMTSFDPISQIPHLSLDNGCEVNTSYGSLDHHRHFTPTGSLGVPTLVAHPPSPGRAPSPMRGSQASPSELSKLLHVHGSRERGYSDPARPSNDLAELLSPGMRRVPSTQGTSSSDSDAEMSDGSPLQLASDAKSVSKANGSAEMKPVDFHQRLPRGKRKRPLTEQEKKDAKNRRVNKSVCIRCKVNRAKCPKDTGASSCRGCLAAMGRNRGPVVCVQANFLELVRTAATSHPPHLSIEHLRLDMKTRRRILFPARIRLDSAVERLDAIRSRFDIRVSLGSRSLCVLDLDKCYQYMASVRHGQGGAIDFDFRAFLDKGALKTDEWQDCLKSWDEGTEHLDLLPTWTNMPGRATYSYLLKDRPHMSGQLREKDINVDIEEDRRNLLVASLLFHIFVRKLELVAFTKLQKKLHDAYKQKADDVPDLLKQVGRTLLTLRWRFSWYQEFGSSVPWNSQEEKARFDHRLFTLCKILYFFFCCLEKRLPGDMDKKKIWGEKRRYEDTTTDVDDEFPTIESVEGFREWMRKGRTLIEVSGAVRREQEMGLVGGWDASELRH